MCNYLHVEKEWISIDVGDREMLKWRLEMLSPFFVYLFTYGRSLICGKGFFEDKMKKMKKELSNNEKKVDENIDKPRKKKGKQKKGEKQPYAGTHGYTEEEVNEIIKKQRRKGK